MDLRPTKFIKKVIKFQDNNIYMKGDDSSPPFPPGPDRVKNAKETIAEQKNAELMFENLP